eukprot:jgi/Chlat1/6816/Chrsp51S06562
MDGAKFAKLCKDCKLISKKFTTTDVDLTYAKAKAKGERKINFEQFTKALELIAEKKGCPVDEVTAAAVPRAPVGSLEELFVAFASFGGSKTVNEMDGTKFAKLCKDTGLIDKKFTTTVCARTHAHAPTYTTTPFVTLPYLTLVLRQSADIIFSKVKAKGERKITYEGFAKALPLIAAEKGGMDVEAMKAKLLAAGGPIANGTKAEAVKFHDDKSLYTGVHAKGGPSTVDNKISLSNLADRSAADVRGIKISD